jgi:hypothetical protein
MMKWIVRSAVMLSVGGTPFLAQTESGTGWTPALEVLVVASTPQGEVTKATGDRSLLKGGEPFSVTVTTSDSLCSVAIGRTKPPASTSHSNAWRLTGQYLGEEAGRHQIRVTSGFSRPGGRESSATTEQTLSLREGDKLVLDALKGPLDSACQVRNVTIQARLVMQPSDPALARATYTADLWLVHTDPGGREQREHLITNVAGPGATPFTFNRLSFPIPVVDAQQGDAEAFIQLTGAIRTRARTDGLVDVDLDTNRMLFGMDRPSKPSSYTVPPTRKTLTLKPGETTAIEFPPPSSGYSMLTLGDAQTSGRLAGGVRATGPGSAPAADGSSVEVKDGRLVLHTHRFFKGHRTQLLLTLRRLR